MEKEFVPYEQALKLKELGFDEPCLVFWTNNPKYKGEDIQLCITDGNHGCSPNSISFKQDFLREGEVLAPTFSQAFRWFREKYELFSSCDISNFADKTYGYVITSPNPPHYLHNVSNLKSIEEAEFACLRKLIELV